MDALALILYIAAVVLLTLAAVGVRTRWAHLGWLGLAVAVFTLGVLLTEAVQARRAQDPHRSRG